MRLKIVTWNINSVRLRLPLAERLIETYKPDILCLQETKVPDAAFPSKAFAKLGLKHQAINGQKGYHGVAILSRLRLEEEEKSHLGGKADHARHVAVTLPGGLRLHNFYVPAGGDEPDPDLNEKFAHKLAYLDDMAATFSAPGRVRDEILVGDLNVAPFEHDVWSHRQLLSVVSHTPVEVERLDSLRRSRDWIDVARRFVPMDQKLYSWWSYRAADWEKSDRGRRLDHIWVTPDLGDALSSFAIAREARSWPQPSDHVPVMTVLKL